MQVGSVVAGQAGENIVLNLVLLLVLTPVYFVSQLTPKPEFEGEGGLGKLSEEAYDDIKVAIDEVKDKFMGKLDVVYKAEDTKLTITVKMMAKDKVLELEKNEALEENARLIEQVKQLTMRNHELENKVSKASNSHSHTTPHLLLYASHLLLHASHTLARASLCTVCRRWTLPIRQRRHRPQTRRQRPHKRRQQKKRRRKRRRKRPMRQSRSRERRCACAEVPVVYAAAKIYRSADIAAGPGVVLLLVGVVV